mmetsp:Transcript_33776/g.39358  ORF Transcript_33776/g.39358 Transcript_33776/m.39358 type:complete len:771 (-) Transcript_33776:723-3035(-)
MMSLLLKLTHRQKPCFQILASASHGRRKQCATFSTTKTRTGVGKNTSLFNKILVANRGEIACRVIRTAKRLGVQTVALYSDVDGPNSIHAKMADEAYQIGTGPSPTESYLRGDEVIDIALQSGAQAIHPGYGFLSENFNFAQNVSKSNLSFIGPPPTAILAMGSKSHSKKIMEDAGVPCTPGYHGDNQSEDHLFHQAVTNVGFPLLIKASMGGGGKGMRLVWKESDFKESLQSCKRESQSAFGDQNVILEKYLVNPRHIEIQVMADTHGNAVYLHERDCSLQRRHQKIIEEAPASDLSSLTRKIMGETAVTAAKAVGYVNAGTVEFMLDSKGEDFYFCEMNTRLQVEHPVTEMITNQDLVEWQLRIAAGEELPIVNQDLIPCEGHAMEARIYAENPAKDFLPVIGKVWHHRPPAEPNTEGSDIRVDTGIEAGKDITVYYDPMVSKLIVKDQTREKCRQKLVTALKAYQIDVHSNIPFLIECAEHDVFKTAGAINTGFLDEYGSDINLNYGDELGTLEQAICAFVVALTIENRVGPIARARSPWSNQGSWRAGGPGGRIRRVLEPEQDEKNSPTKKITCISNHDGSFDIAVATNEGSEETIKLSGTLESNNLQVIVNDIKRKSFTATTIEDIENGKIKVNVWSSVDKDSETVHSFQMSLNHPLPTSSSNRIVNSYSESSSGTHALKAPMPGKVTRINSEGGDNVNENEIILVIEAMKMEHSIPAPMTGKLEVNCSVGDVVNESDVLAFVTVDEEKENTASMLDKEDVSSMP